MLKLSRWRAGLGASDGLGADHTHARAHTGRLEEQDNLVLVAIGRKPKRCSAYLVCWPAASSSSFSFSCSDPARTLLAASSQVDQRAIFHLSRAGWAPYFAGALTLPCARISVTAPSGEVPAMTKTETETDRRGCTVLYGPPVALARMRPARHASSGRGDPSTPTGSAGV